MPFALVCFANCKLREYLRNTNKISKYLILCYILFAGLYKYRFEGRMVNVRASCAGSLEVKSRTGQILHSVANGSLQLQHLRKQLYCLGAMTRRWAPQIRYTLRRNTASILKVFFFYLVNTKRWWNPLPKVNLDLVYTYTKHTRSRTKIIFDRKCHPYLCFWVSRRRLTIISQSIDIIINEKLSTI